MNLAVTQDILRLNKLAFGRAEWGAPVLEQYHNVIHKAKATDLPRFKVLYEWMFVPISLWPLNIQDVLTSSLTALQNGKQMSVRCKLLVDLLSQMPNPRACESVAAHEHDVAIGAYDQLIKSNSKYSQTELSIKTNAQLQDDWSRIKCEFRVSDYQDYKGLIRRSMNSERNLRNDLFVDMRKPNEVFQAVFNAFCHRWNLYGMLGDDPLLLKLSVNITPYGTTIHIPTYWSFDPKRDVRWDAIAKLHRARVQKRQGSVLAEGYADRLIAAKKLLSLDSEAKRKNLRGEAKHEFLCKGLGWDPRSSSKRISRLRAEFKSQNLACS